jgi:hypothetical protein
MLLALRNYVARFLCWRHGHRRGKRVSPSEVACRRCGTTWARAERKKAAKGSAV